MDFREIYGEDRRWMELVQDHVQWWNLLLVVLNPWSSAAIVRQLISW